MARKKCYFVFLFVVWTLDGTSLIPVVFAPSIFYVIHFRLKSHLRLLCLGLTLWSVKETKTQTTRKKEENCETLRHIWHVNWCGLVKPISVCVPVWRNRRRITHSTYQRALNPICRKIRIRMLTSKFSAFENNTLDCIN